MKLFNYFSLDLYHKLKNQITVLAQMKHANLAKFDPRSGTIITVGRREGT